MNSTSKSLILTILMIASTMAGCLGGDEGDVDLDGEDGGIPTPQMSITTEC